ncbi:MAG: hypothetical protein FWE22_04300 [Firmicutes bacterium]|nr:hypothetical protein [Bacillota bacterium]
MIKDHNKQRKKAYCPVCGTLLCTGIFGESIQNICRGKSGVKCDNLIDINFSERGVETIVITPNRSSSA